MKSLGLALPLPAVAASPGTAPGTPGKDSATIQVGEGQPSEDAGKAGDLYLDAESGDLWQKET